jgi:hypothetical protein
VRKLDLSLSCDLVEVSVDGSSIEDVFCSIAFGSDAVVHESNMTGDRWARSPTVGDNPGQR